jgi:hypothetical protein
MPGGIDASGRKVEVSARQDVGRRLLFVESRWSEGRQLAGRWREERSFVECRVGESNNWRGRLELRSYLEGCSFGLAVLA